MENNIDKQTDKELAARLTYRCNGFDRVTSVYLDCQFIGQIPNENCFYTGPALARAYLSTQAADGPARVEACYRAEVQRLLGELAKVKADLRLSEALLADAEASLDQIHQDYPQIRQAQLEQWRAGKAPFSPIGDPTRGQIV